MFCFPLQRLAGLALAGAGALMAFAGHAQTAAYPTQPITFIVPYAAGGSSDTRSRQLAQKLGEYLGTTVVVENKPGASGNIGTSLIARAKPDGYTIGLGNFAPLSVNRALYGDNLSFNPQTDLLPIALIERGAMVLGVRAKSPYTSAQALIDDARKTPNKLNYASTGAGGASHLVSELFLDTQSFKATHVPYRGGAPAVNDLIAGNVDFYLELASLFIPQMQGDQPRVRALAVAADARLQALPDVPTFRELGIDGMVASNWFGVIAPAGTPSAIILQLNAAINRALQDPQYRAVVESQGAEVAGGTPEDFRAFIALESDRWARLIREKAISVQ